MGVPQPSIGIILSPWWSYISAAVALSPCRARSVVRTLRVFIIDGSTPPLERNNRVALVDFHILSGGTFALQSPHSRQFCRGIFLLGSSLIDLINIWYLLAGNLRNNSFT